MSGGPFVHLYHVHVCLRGRRAGCCLRRQGKRQGKGREKAGKGREKAGHSLRGTVVVKEREEARELVFRHRRPDVDSRVPEK